MYSKVVPTLNADIAKAVNDETDTPGQQRIPQRPLRLEPIDDTNAMPSMPQSPLDSWRVEEPAHRTDDTAAAIAATSGLGLGPGKNGGVGALASGSTSPTTRRIADTVSVRKLDDDEQRGSDATIEWNQTGSGGLESTCSGVDGGGHRLGARATEPPCLPSFVPGGAPILGSRVAGEAGAARAAPAKRGEEWGSGTGTANCSAANAPQAKTPATPELFTAWAKLRTGKTEGAGNDTKGEGGRGGRGGGGGGRQYGGMGLESSTMPKRDSGLPGLVRPRVLSYAEENQQDVSAEINSLSKVR